MTGFRKLETYINQYGDVEGRKRYETVLRRRALREVRMSYPDDARVECAGCGAHMKRITPTHLKHNCVESIDLAEYQRRYPNALVCPSGVADVHKITEETLVERYGKEQGQIKWQSYRKKQATSNSFEYKQEKHGWSLEEYNEYNQTRASTLSNFIARHGEEDGLLKWKEYVERQRYTTSLSYFIETYGLANGTTKYLNFVEKRSFAGCDHRSKVEMLAFESIKVSVEELQLSVRLDNLYWGPYDYGNLASKKLIEFYGTYWHADPRFYDREYFFKQKQQFAHQIWARDRAKRTFALNRGFRVCVIWEHDWYNDKQGVIDYVTEWWKK